MFLMNYTQINIAYAVSKLRRYSHKPSKEHWDALFRLLKYLRGTMNWCFHFNKFPAVLEGLYDTNWFLIIMKLVLLVATCLPLLKKLFHGSLPSRLV